MISRGINATAANVTDDDVIELRRVWDESDGNTVKAVRWIMTRYRLGLAEAMNTLKAIQRQSRWQIPSNDPNLVAEFQRRFIEGRKP